MSFLKLEVVGVDHVKQEFTARMPLRPELARRPGTKQFHGGPIAPFIDIVGDFAIGMLVGGGVPTLNLGVEYLRPALGDALLGVGRVRKAGRTTAIVDIKIRDENDKLVALGRGTYASQTG